jgi:phosphoglycerol transferase MdoB-like AlkP superfamily enzyme
MAAVSYQSDNTELMRISPTSWREWFTASLFPFKIYTVLVAVILAFWHIGLPAYPWRTGFDEARGVAHNYAAETAYSDFGYIANYAVFGYFLCAGVLIIGGIVQIFTSSRRAAFISIAFGIAAVVIGRLLFPYSFRGQTAVL